MKAADVMTVQVITVEPDAPISKAVRLMLQHHISGLPVVDRAGRLVGIVTEGDFLRRAETGTDFHRPQWLENLVSPGRLAEEYVRTHARSVDEVMSTDVATVTEDAPLDDVIRLMEHRHIKRIPVVRGGRLVGIISRANLLRALAVRMLELPAPAAGDQAIRAKILAEYRNKHWNTGAGIDVTVHDGIVELWGAIMDERERQAYRVAAENVPGVLAVKDNLCWVEPMSGVVIEAPKENLPAEDRAHI
ncbi:MAG TPA: CBS domain-containing protein [Bradyrhizobium sp.]|nr:CBS domain-containing protein [Bradyrhizobium sp.]